MLARRVFQQAYERLDLGLEVDDLWIDLRLGGRYNRQAAQKSQVRHRGQGPGRALQKSSTRGSAKHDRLLPPREILRGSAELVIVRWSGFRKRAFEEGRKGRETWPTAGPFSHDLRTILLGVVLPIRPRGQF